MYAVLVPYALLDVAELFARARVVGRNGCWEWTGRPTGSQRGTGYGEWRGKYAHRVAYEMCVGPIPEGHVVMHRCDNTLCVKPDHLLTGTQADNIADMVAKGRQRGGGGAIPKLTAEQRAAIAADPRVQRLIAADYGISQGHVSRIKRDG